MINEFDKRQLNIMLEKIDAFVNNQLEIEFLLNDLEALLKILETIDNDWRKKFYAEWLNIEEMYAYALSEERKFLNKDEQEVIYDSISKIKQLIFKYL